MDATRDILARRPSLVVLDLNPPHIGGEVGDGISARHGRAVTIAMVGASREVAEMGGELDAGVATEVRSAAISYRIQFGRP